MIDDNQLLCKISWYIISMKNMSYIKCVWIISDIHTRHDTCTITTCIYICVSLANMKTII